MYIFQVMDMDDFWPLLLRLFKWRLQVRCSDVTCEMGVDKKMCLDGSKTMMDL